MSRSCQLLGVFMGIECSACQCLAAAIVDLETITWLTCPEIVGNILSTLYYCDLTFRGESLVALSVV